MDLIRDICFRRFPSGDKGFRDFQKVRYTRVFLKTQFCFMSVLLNEVGITCPGWLAQSVFQIRMPSQRAELVKQF